MPDSIEETIWGTGKLCGVIAKLKLRLNAEFSLADRGLSEMFTTHLSLRLVPCVEARCFEVSCCDTSFFVVLPIVISV